MSRKKTPEFCTVVTCFDNNEIIGEQEIISSRRKKPKTRFIIPSENGEIIVNNLNVGGGITCVSFCENKKVIVEGASGKIKPERIRRKEPLCGHPAKSDVLVYSLHGEKMRITFANSGIAYEISNEETLVDMLKTRKVS